MSNPHLDKFLQDQGYIPLGSSWKGMNPLATNIFKNTEDYTLIFANCNAALETMIQKGEKTSIHIPCAQLRLPVNKALSVELTIDFDRLLEPSELPYPESQLLSPAHVDTYFNVRGTDLDDVPLQDSLDRLVSQRLSDVGPEHVAANKQRVTTTTQDDDKESIRHSVYGTHLQSARNANIEPAQSGKGKPNRRRRQKIRKRNRSSTKPGLLSLHQKFQVEVWAWILQEYLHKAPEEDRRVEAVISAAFECDFMRMSLLLSFGVDVNCLFNMCTQHLNVTPLHALLLGVKKKLLESSNTKGYISRVHQHFGKGSTLEAAVVLLLSRRADVNSGATLSSGCSVVTQGVTPLMIGCIIGTLDAVLWLISYGADATLQDGEGNTVFHYASAAVQPHIIATLLDEGVGEYHARNKAGYTALDLLEAMLEFDGAGMNIVPQCDMHSNFLDKEKKMTQRVRDGVLECRGLLLEAHTEMELACRI